MQWSWKMLRGQLLHFGQALLERIPAFGLGIAGIDLLHSVGLRVYKTYFI
jgi:hypothetical protein